ncbi:MAG: type II secretion system F family protein [Deltaproteobacteria bacterium]|nr:type II secretion system F family protein [Deltaproteobacteria bacterium]
MKFAFTALDDSGTTVNEVIEADSREDAISKILARGLIPQKVEQEDRAAASGRSVLDMLAKVKPQELILFTKQFRTMFKAGISVMDLLRTLEDQTENPKLKRTVATMTEDIKNGSSLYSAFSKHPGIFSPLYCSMVRAGEASGALPEVLNRLTYLLDHEFSVRNDIKSALQYPIIVVIALGIAFFVLLTFVIPKFVTIFESAGLDLPLPTVMAIGLYRILADYWYLVIGGLIALIVGLRLYLKTPNGRYVRDLIFLKMPILGPVFQKAAMSRFASIFAILQASGIAVLDTLDILSGTIGNAAISWEFDKIKERLKQGRGISEPLRKARFFTPMVVNMVAIGEESGNLDEMLNEISVHYDEEVAYAVSKMSTNLGPILIVGLAAVVGFFALAIFLPMWDLTQMASR